MSEANQKHLIDRGSSDCAFRLKGVFSRKTDYNHPQHIIAYRLKEMSDWNYCFCQFELSMNSSADRVRNAIEPVSLSQERK